MDREQDPTSNLAQRPPLLAGRFVLTRRIGKGGTANVYLAFDLQLNRWRAVKIMHKRFADDDEMRERFDREARMMARIDDRNVVRVLDVQMGDLPYMVMEYMEAGCVLDWMRAHARMPPHLAIKITEDLASGLIATHAQGVIHRDVKPHNLLVNRFGECKLTDYGIAKLLSDKAEQPEDEKALTRVGASMGTASFMPPEQRHDASSVDERADIYAVGATLFTFLQRKAGKDLFIADAEEKQFKGMPQPLRELVIKACRYKPEDRYASMDEVRAALRACAAAIEPVGDLSGFPGSYADLPKSAPPLIAYERVRELRELVTEGAVGTSYVPEVVAAAIDGIHAPVWIDVEAYTRTPPPHAVRRPDDIQPMPPLPGDDGLYDPDTDVGLVRDDSDDATPVGADAMSPPSDDEEAAEEDDIADAEGSSPSFEGENLPSDVSTVMLRESTGEVDPKAAAAAGAAGAFGALAAVLSMLLVIGLVVLAGLGYSIAVESSQEMRATEAARLQAEHDLENTLQAEARLVELLVGRGADRARLEKAYFEFQDATDKGDAGLAYGDVLEKQYSAVTSRYGADEQIERSWRQIEAKLHEVEARRQRQEDAQQGLGPLLAGALGM